MSETVQEQEIRGAFATHAPEAVDVAAGWERVQTRMQPDIVATRKRALTWGRGPFRSLAATLAFALILTSAGFLTGFVYSHACFTGGTLFLCSDLPQLSGGNFFQTVNQHQTVNGVTVTITSVYADRGVTMVAFTTQLAPELAKQYDSAYPVTITVVAANGEQAAFPPSDGRGTLCDAPERDQSVTACYTRFGPLHPGASTTTVDVTVMIPSVALHRGASNTAITGPWQFHFAMNYAQIDRHILQIPANSGPNQAVPVSPAP